MKLLDWAGRVVMLVLAGMVTLSIIGAIAAIPSGSIPPRLGFEPATRAAPEAGERTQDVPDEIQLRGRPDRAASGSDIDNAQSPGPPDQDPDRWLEAITYALLALAGLAALACLLLWRGLHQRRRIAEALERLARASP